VWGIVDMPHAARQFAELVAFFARQEGGLDVMMPAEVERRLRAAGLKPTLEPTSAQLKAFAKALGCSSYITVELRAWRLSYELTAQSARVRFTLSGYRPDADRPLWSVDVSHVGHMKSEREVAIEALRETFRRLRRPESEGRDVAAGH